MPRFLNRFTSAARAKEVLAGQRLYLASPASLNDPFELAGAVDFECSEDDRREILDLAAKHKLRLSDEQIRATEERRNSMAKTDFYIYVLSLEIRGVLRYLYEFSGVCCFTRSLEHPPLWSHYADAHRGVCLVFNNLDGKCSIFETVIPVIYSDTMPAVRLLDCYKRPEQFKEQLFRLLHTKQTVWSYEQEWRVVVPSKHPTAAENR